jgi:hypothetical protein
MIRSRSRALLGQDQDYDRKDFRYTRASTHHLILQLNRKARKGQEKNWVQKLFESLYNAPKMGSGLDF